MAFNSAKAVFIGQVLGGTEQLSSQDQSGESHTIEAGQVRFVVEEVFKGSLANETTIEIASHKGTSCGPYGLKRGERYVVYAYGSEKDSENLYSGVCTRTAPIDSSYAKVDLEFLRNLPPAGTGGKIRGRIWADLRAGGATPLPNVKVSIRSSDAQVITLITDKEGNFEVERLKPGRYRVEPTFPAHHTSDHQFAEVTVDDLGTATVGFEAHLDGKVSGRLTDKNGRGFNSAFLHLVAESKSVYGHSVGRNAGFDAEGVPPGEYVLYLEMEGSDSTNAKEYYYPGTFKREDAAVIKVELGEAVEGLEFRLPDDVEVRTVEGQVNWADGKPAAGVEVMLLCPTSAKVDGFVVESFPTHTRTNEQGRFQLEGFTGEVYWIEARGSKKGAKQDELLQVHSPSRKIVLSENLKGTTLVLSEKGFSGSCGK